MADITLTSAPVTWKLANQIEGSRARGANGFVEFEASAVAAHHGALMWLPSPQRVDMVDGVLAPLDLPINDPAVWNWRVTPRVGVQWTPFHINVEEGGTDLATAAVVPGKGPVKVVQGPAGASVVDFRDTGDGALVLVLSDGTESPPIPFTRGPAGPANEITVGTVMRGDEPYASLVGEAPNQVLNLVLPKGDPGSPEDLVDATPERRGLMSAADKALLDELPTAPVAPERLPVATEAVAGTVTLNSINGIAATATETAMSDAATVDELFATVVLTASPTITTVLVAPYPLRITTITMVFDAMSLAAHPDNNLTVTWRKYAGSGTVLVSKSSAAQSIAQREPWRFDTATWNESARTLQEGEMLNLGFTAAGSGSTVVFPVHATIGYEPL